MVANKDIEMLNALQPEGQELVVSMIKSLFIQKEETEAQKRFREMRKKYVTKGMNMDKVDKMIHGED